MLGSRKMEESYAPACASLGAFEPAKPRIELGMLRNGLGSIRNLELLIKSIKVGQKGLFSAITAVHADCAAMIADALALSGSLTAMAVDARCAERLGNALATSLKDLESMLAGVVDSGRLSVAQRLKLERDLSRCARELSSTLPLVSLFERTCRPRPLELTPVELVHASSSERSEQKSVSVLKLPSPSAATTSLSVDLEAAKALVAIGVALVLEASPEGRPRLGFELQSGEAPVSIISVGPEKPAALEATPKPFGGHTSPPVAPAFLHIAPVRLSAPSESCAEVAANRLGGRFEYTREARRVCIYWPLS